MGSGGGAGVGAGAGSGAGAGVGAAAGAGSGVEIGSAAGGDAGVGSAGGGITVDVTSPIPSVGGVGSLVGLGIVGVGSSIGTFASSVDSGSSSKAHPARRTAATIHGHARIMDQLGASVAVSVPVVCV